MTASALLSGLAGKGLHLSRRGGSIVISPKGAVTPDIIKLVSENKPELLSALQDLDAAFVQEIPDPNAERRLQMVMEQLSVHEDRTYAVYSEERETGYLITVGIRDRGTIELRIPRHRMDAARMVEILDRHNLH